MLIEMNKKASLSINQQLIFINQEKIQSVIVDKPYIHFVLDGIVQKCLIIELSEKMKKYLHDEVVDYE